MTDSIQAGIEICRGIVMPIRHRVFLEELETMVISDFLAGVDQGLGTRQCPAKDGHSLPSIPHSLELSAVPRVLIVIRCEHKTVRITIFLGIPLDISQEAISVRLTLGNVI